MIRSVAVIGAGSMGAAIARHIQQAGFELTVCDVNEAVLADFEAAGARAVRRPADCAGADLVIVLVVTPDQVRAVLLGEHGLRAGLGPGRAPVVAVMSTVPVDLVHALRDSLGSQVGHLVDAPISGGPVRAERGTLAVMVGGDAAVVEALRPVLSTFAADVVRCGPLGAGQAMKIVNNIVGNANAVFTAEAYRLATELGLEIADTARALEVSMGRNAFSAHPDDLPATYAAMVRDRAGFDALLGLMRKDIGFATQLTANSAARYPAIEALQTIMASLGAETYDNWQHIAASPARRGPGST